MKENIISKFYTSELRKKIKKDGVVKIYYKLNNEIIHLFSLVKNKNNCKLDLNINENELFNLGIFKIRQKEFLTSTKLTELLKVINFQKMLLIEKVIIDDSKINFISMIGDSNPEKLPFNDYVLDDNPFGSEKVSKVLYWSEESYFRVFKRCLNFLDLSYKELNNKIFWNYNGISFETGIGSKGWIGYGVVWYLYTTPIKNQELKNLYNKNLISSSNIIFSCLIDWIKLTNIYNKVGKYKNINISATYRNKKDIVDKMQEFRILHDGDPTYISDSVFDGHNDKDVYIKDNNYLKSSFPDILIVKNKMLDYINGFGVGFLQELKDLNIDRLNLGNYGYRELYVHPNPYKHSSYTCWRYSDSFILDLNNMEIEYYHSTDNKMVNLPSLYLDENNNCIIEIEPLKLHGIYKKLRSGNGTFKNIGCKSF